MGCDLFDSMQTRGAIFLGTQDQQSMFSKKPASFHESFSAMTVESDVYFY